MEKHPTPTLKLWNLDELEFPEEVTVATVIAKRRRFALVVCLVSILVICIALVGWQTAQAAHYQRVVQHNATLITQQSARETTCFQKAQSVTQRDTCSQKASVTAASLQRQFGMMSIPASQQAAANDMQSAYAALAAASCYDAANNSADATCLSGIASRLRVAILDAHDAAQN